MTAVIVLKDRKTGFSTNMAVKHILKDGTVLDDITGHIVKEQDAPPAYTAIESTEKTVKNKETKDTDNRKRDRG